jgi:hypothetical protein
VENPYLRKIVLLLQESLQESDISSCTTIWRHIGKTFEDHLIELEKSLTVCSLHFCMVFNLTVLEKHPWKSVIHYRSLDRSKYVTFYGCYCTLDWNFSTIFIRHLSCITSLLRADRIYLCSTTPHWRASL